MKTQIHLTDSQSQTRDVGRSVAKFCINIAEKKPVVVLLYGQLGAGKTTFVKGMGEELGIVDITSPTFIIIDEYDIKNSKVRKFFHIDLYRVSNDGEFKNLKIVDEIKPATITCIEWSENITPIMDEIIEKATVIKVYIEHMSENKRQIKIEI